jgi:hypothetical protein
LDRAKSVYGVDEPIEIVASIENQGSAEVRILAYPSFGGGFAGLTFMPAGGLKPVEQNLFDWMEAIVPIAGGRSLTARIDLQHFLTGFSPRHYPQRPSAVTFRLQW